MLRWLGFAHLLEVPAGPLGGSSRLVVYCMGDMVNLLGAEGLSKYSCSVVPPPTVLPPPASHGGVAEEAPSDHFLVGYFGLSYPGKGLEWLLRGLHLALQSGIPVKLIVIGGSGAVTANQAWNQICEDYSSSLKQLARDLGIQGIIMWCGYQDDKEAAKLIADCQAICLPFEDGVTGLRSSFVECATIGVPLITTLTGGTDEYLRAENSGILFVAPENSEQIAAAISRLYADPGLRQACREQVRRFAAKNFRSGAFVDALDW